MDHPSCGAGVIAFLNGVDLEKSLFSAGVLFAKIVGVTFACGSSLAVGPEGPMIHIGAATGLGAVEISICGQINSASKANIKSYISDSRTPKNKMNSCQIFGRPNMLRRSDLQVPPAPMLPAPVPPTPLSPSSWSWGESLHPASCCCRRRGLWCSCRI